METWVSCRSDTLFGQMLALLGLGEILAVFINVLCNVALSSLEIKVYDRLHTLSKQSQMTSPQPDRQHFAQKLF